MLQDIINYICTMLQMEFKNMPVNIQDKGRNVIRPSFFVHFIKQDTEEVERWCFGSNTQVQIVYHAHMNEDGNPDAAEQYAIYDRLKKIFYRRKIGTTDKSVFVRQLSGGMQNGQIYMNIMLEHIENVEISNNAESAASMSLNLKSIRG